ncbi:membrane integrity-associated transporter subunit PqiC [Luteolibacter algae]|uniref:Membrane integrity-associated transporter subunit PqiC n=1 Tax=Luteolibacter algae TaxID=454151 RepID=A0ABW5D7T9_9BACT
MKTYLLLLIPLCFSGCTLLKPVEDDPVRHLLESSVSGKTATGSAPAVAIARPSLPPYLERVELVTRTGDGRLQVHEKELWSEPLDAGIARVIADNLRRLTGSTNVQPTANFITRDYTDLVEIRIERFDPLPDGSLVLECTWKVQPINGGDASPKPFKTIVPIQAGKAEGLNVGMSGRIVAMNEALARLSRTISKSL